MSELESPTKIRAEDGIGGMKRETKATAEEMKRMDDRLSGIAKQAQAMASQFGDVFDPGPLAETNALLQDAEKRGLLRMEKDSRGGGYVITGTGADG